jgi:threonylcarbamoyladenosine tRNA methylthiotransferase MtaB
MGRRYTTEQFERLLITVRQRIPEISITTDVIVGFPGESEAEFEASFAFIERMRFARLHVFRYSPRPGTPAANWTSSSLPHNQSKARLASMRDSVPPPVAQMRSDVLIALGRRMSLDFHRQFVGATVQVLCESAKAVCGGFLWSGLTDNYLRVSAPAPDNLANTLVMMRCDDADETGLRGEVLSTSPIV